MNITSAQYIQNMNNQNDCIKTVIDSKTLYVPLDPANRHYAAIIEWAEEDSNEIVAAD